MNKCTRALGIGMFAVAAVTLAACSTKSATTNASAVTTTSTVVGTTTSTAAAAPSATSAPPTTAATAGRQVKGTLVTLGAGTFAGGTDIAIGLYDVAGGAGQSGNFTVNGRDSYNEVLGDAASLGVPMVRTTISSGDQIQISGLSSVTFTPVSTPASNSHTTTTIYAGTWTVGQDLGGGRYVATPGAGQSGNFTVSGSDSYNEILGGDSSMGGVPSLTVTLSKGDVIAVSGLSQVTLTAQ